MRLVSVLLVLGFASNAMALEQYWIEEKDGRRQACYSPGFFAMLGGNRTCAPFNGNTPPDRNALRIAAAAPEDIPNYQATGERITTTRNGLRAAETRVNEINQTVERMAANHPCSNIRPENVVEMEDCRAANSTRFERLHRDMADQRAALREPYQQMSELEDNLVRAQVDQRTIEDRARLANQIIATKDVMYQMDRLRNRLEDSRETLAAVERAFNKTILEAYVYQKMQKMAANLCEAQAQCPNAGEASKKLMNQVFDAERIHRDAKGAPTQRRATQ
jgi:hypothetical protein